MKPSTLCTLSAALLLAGCHSYTPQPVDVPAHVTAFAERFRLLERDGGLPRDDAREAAKVLHPDARLARRRAGVATAVRDNAGRWVDPQLGGTLQKILESVPHPWVPQAAIGLTLPINGRLDRQRNLAERQRDEAVVRAWQTEQQVANELDRAWVGYSAARVRVELLAELIDNLTSLEQLANALVLAGNLTKPGARVFSLERSEREIAHAQAEAELSIAALRVRQRLGLHPDAPLELLPELDVQPFVADAAGRRAAVTGSPQVLLLQLAHQSAEADVELQIRMQWPDISLSPGWQEEDAQPRASLGFNIPLPVFTGNDPEIARARADRELTAEALRCGVEGLLQQLAIAEVQRDLAAAQRERVQGLLELADAQVRGGRRLADAGQFDPLLQLDALVRVYDVQLQALQARADHALATIAINELLTDPASHPPQTDAGASR